MKVHSLGIENFLTIGEANISLADRGLLGVQGVNNDDSSASSNGSGKSTIADALCWLLFGLTARGVGGDAVVNRTVGKNTRVIGYILDDATTYVVARHRKHATGKNSLTLGRCIGATGVDDLTQGTDKLTQEKLEQVLGCSYEVFRAAVYMGQESMPDLPGMTDKQLKVLVEEAAGVTMLERAYEIARKRAAEAKAALNVASTATEMADQALERAREQERQAIDDGREWETERSTAIDDTELAIKLAEDGIKTVRDAVAAIDKPDLIRQRDELNAQLAGITAEQAEERRLSGLSNDANKALSIAESRFTQARERAQKAKHDLDHIEGKIGTGCSECGKTYEADDLAVAGAAQRKSITDLIAEATTHKTHVAAATKSATAAQSALDAYRASMTDASDATAKLAVVTRKLDALTQLENKLATHASMQLQRAERVAELRSQESPWPKKIKAIGELIAKLTESVKEAGEKLTAATEAAALADDAVKVFSPAGVRAQILDTVTPYLNERTSHYLGTLSDGNIAAVWTTLARTAKGELREKFTIDVTHAKGGETFAAISGGEKRKVRLGCALALQDLVATRASKPIDLFIGDEIDDALDDAGMERLMTVLDEKSRERGSVIIVSHNSLRDWIRNMVTVEKSGGLSTLVE